MWRDGQQAAEAHRSGKDTTDVRMTGAPQPRQAQTPGLPISLFGTQCPQGCVDAVGLGRWFILGSGELQGRGRQQPPGPTPSALFGREALKLFF